MVMSVMFLASWSLGVSSEYQTYVDAPIMHVHVQTYR
jgi:hypothetical protein